MDDPIDYLAPTGVNATTASDVSQQNSPQSPSDVSAKMSNPAYHNVWMDFLRNMAGSGFGAGAGNSQASKGNNMSQNPAPNSAAQSAATSAAVNAAAGAAGASGGGAGLLGSL